MNKREREEIKLLINALFAPSNTYHRYSSYGLKSIFEELLETYISNDDFKQIMGECGFYGTNEQNKRYKIQVRHHPQVNSVFWDNGGKTFYKQ